MNRYICRRQYWCCSARLYKVLISAWLVGERLRFGCNLRLTIRHPTVRFLVGFCVFSCTDFLVQKELRSFAIKDCVSARRCPGWRPARKSEPRVVVSRKGSTAEGSRLDNFERDLGNLDYTGQRQKGTWQAYRSCPLASALSKRLAIRRLILRRVEEAVNRWSRVWDLNTNTDTNAEAAIRATTAAAAAETGAL